MYTYLYLLSELINIIKINYFQEGIIIIIGTYLSISQFMFTMLQCENYLKYGKGMEFILNKYTRTYLFTFLYSLSKQHDV